MKPNHTDITIVLDRSGSMSAIAGDTIGGFNMFLQDQKAAPGSATITLHQFDYAFDTVIDGVDIKAAPELTGETFVPRGTTALLDAIGQAINSTGARLAGADESQRAEKVVFVIITDGQENASTKFNALKVEEMITHQREKYSWEFVFLGANQDAIMTAGRLGIAAANSMTYAANAVGTQAVFDSTSANLTAFRSAGVPMTYSAKDRKKQRDAGANDDQFVAL